MAKIRVTTEDDKQIPTNTEASTINMTLFSALKTMKLYVNEYALQYYFAKTHLLTYFHFSANLLCNNHILHTNNTLLGTNHILHNQYLYLNTTNQTILCYNLFIFAYQPPPFWIT